MNKISNILLRTLNTIEIALWKFNVPTFVGISQPLIFALKRIFIWRWSVFKGTTAWKVVSQSHEEGIWKFNFALIKYLASIKYLTSVNSEERENPPDAFDSPVAYLWESILAIVCQSRIWDIVSNSHTLWYVTMLLINEWMNGSIKREGYLGWYQ